MEAILASTAVTRFDVFSPNPTVEQALDTARLAAREACQGIVAVAGGCGMDVAKAAALAARPPGIACTIVRGRCLYETDPLPIIAALGTAPGRRIPDAITPHR